MKPGLFILPFVAILIAATFAALASAFPETKWLSYLGLTLALGMISTWILLDLDGFRQFFRRKGTKYGASSGAVVVLGFFIIVAFAVLGARPRFNKSIDLTRDKINTLSEQSIKVVQNLRDSKKGVEITAFIVDDKVKNDLRDLLQLYQVRGADFKIEVIDPRQDPTRATAEKITDGNTVIFRLNDQEKRLTIFTEEKITNSLVTLLKAKSRKIYFTKGHGEGAVKGTDASGFETVSLDLQNNKYEVEELGLLESGKVPDDADALIVAGPKYDFKAEEIKWLGDFLMSGRSLIVLAPTATPLPNMASFLEDFGISLNNDYLVMPPELTQTRAYAPNSVLLTDFDSQNPVTKDFAGQSAVAVQIKNARSLSEISENKNQMKVSTVAKTHASMYSVAQVKVPSDLNDVTEDRLTQGSKPVMIIATGRPKAPQAEAHHAQESTTDKEQLQSAKNETSTEIRLIVAGSNIAANDAVYLAETRDLFLNAVNYALQDENFIAIRPRDPTKSTLDIASGKATLSLLLLAWIYPFCFLGAGTYGWLRRRSA